MKTILPTVILVFLMFTGCTKSICACPVTGDIGLIFSIETGDHSYFAKELECTGTNRVNSWSGNTIVKSGDCQVIYLDVNE